MSGASNGNSDQAYGRSSRKHHFCPGHMEQMSAEGVQDQSFAPEIQGIVLIQLGEDCADTTVTCFSSIAFLLV